MPTELLLSANSFINLKVPMTHFSFMHSLSHADTDLSAELSREYVLLNRLFPSENVGYFLCRRYIKERLGLNVQVDIGLNLRATVIKAKLRLSSLLDIRLTKAAKEQNTRPQSIFFIDYGSHDYLYVGEVAGCDECTENYFLTLQLPSALWCLSIFQQLFFKDTLYLSLCL